MDLETLEDTYGDAVAAMDVATPVDLKHLFRAGLVEVDELRGDAVTWTDERGLFIAGDVEVEILTLEGHALFVAGNVKAKQLLLSGNVVVMGDLTAESVRGVGGIFSLTVVGAVAVDTVMMDEQFIVQLLGSGEVGCLIDADGGAEELVQLWRDAGSTVTVHQLADRECAS